MRNELAKAQSSVVKLQQSVRTAERELDVSRMDVTSVNSSLSSSVKKIQTLLDHTRGMRKDRADMLQDINATRRRHSFRTTVYALPYFASTFL